jgi:hypothetical protein
VLIKVKVHPSLDLNFAGSLQKKNGLWHSRFAEGSQNISFNALSLSAVINKLFDTFVKVKPV